MSEKGRNSSTTQLLTEKMGIDPEIMDLVTEAEEELRGVFAELDDIMAYNQYKVLEAFQKNRISDRHFHWNTGYGYDDPGREALEKVYADVFRTEAALVRPIIVNGTHALTLTLTGIMRPRRRTDLLHRRAV
jgi:cystathionine beta-lyase family protein involved in aluminum resistance